MTENKNKKLFILDTNVLIVDPSSIFKFNDQDIGIPMVVLEELDNIKSGDRTISRDARVAVRNIAGLVAEGDFQKGVPTPDGGLLKVLIDMKVNDLDKTINDNLIINTVLHAQEHCTDYEEVLLVTNDINMRVKANASGVAKVQAYQSDRVVEDVKFLNKGWVKVESGWIDSIPKEDIDRMSCGEVIFPLYYLPEEVKIESAINTWLFDEGSFVARIDGVDINEQHPSLSKVGLTIKNRDDMMMREAVGIYPRSIQQAIALDAILDREIDVVIMFAGAGSGKTLIAAAGAAEMVAGKKRGYRYDEVLFAKTGDSQFKEEGFLPGTSHEKLMPFAGALYDNMEVIARASKRKDLHPDVAINSSDAIIKLESLTHMRGRSLNQRVVLYDEVQNLNKAQLKTLLSRAGTDCKVILMGNLSQIDNDYISANNSGLTAICEIFSTWERATVVHLESIERSPLAEFVEKNFN